MDRNSRGGCDRRAWKRFVLLACALLCVCAQGLATGCGRSPTSAEADDPAEVLAQLRRVHQERRYTAMEGLVDSARLTTLVRTLMATDRLLQVSQQLREAAQQHVGPSAAEMCNLSMLADFLGPFSRNVAVVSVRVDGDAAWITYQVADRVPLERAELRRAGGRWLYVPDEADAKLPDLLSRLTEELVALKAMAGRGETNERAFMAEYARRVQTPLAAHLAETEQARRARVASADQR